MKVLVAQSCLTLCDPMNCIPPGSPVHGLLQARILEWVAIPSPGGLPDPGAEPRSALQADSLSSESPGKPSAGFLQTYFMQVSRSFCLFFLMSCPCGICDPSFSTRD